MKTPTQTILILLLLAGGIAGYGQTDTLKPGLPDEEVIRLRSELLDVLENDSIEKAKEIKDSLWTAQPNSMEYLSFKEYYLALYLLGEYSKILETYPSVYTYNNDTTRFPRIDLELINLGRARQKEMLDDLRKYYSNSALLPLIGLFSILTDHKPLDYYSLITEYGRLKDKRVKNNPDNFLDDQTVFRIGFGVFYQTGWYYGDISKYFSHYNSASIINAHLSVYKFYLAGTLLNAGGANTKQNIVVNNNLSSATHLSSSLIFDITTGYSCFQKKHFELTPVFFYQWQVNSIERARNRLDPEKLGDINHYGPGFGFIADFIFSNWSWSKNSLNQWAIRLKYGINFSTDNTKTKAVSGILNQFSIGLIYSKLYY